MRMTNSDNKSQKSNALYKATDNLKWEAVLTRNSDAVFFYGVKSTGVYCRPTCASRRPASCASVEFFDTTEAAEAAGYRACLRCKPNESGMWKLELKRVQSACRILERDAHDLKADISLTALAEELGNVSPTYLQKSFKQVLGVSPRQYVDAVRLRQFKAMLRAGERVGIAARASGLKSPNGVYGRKAMEIGLSPQDYQAGAVGAEIVYAILPCPLGFLLLAATARGVCSIKLCDTIDELHTAIHAEFPKAYLREDAASLGPLTLAALSVMGDDVHASWGAQSLPLDIQATAFKWRVWLALRDTPPGSVISYGKLATEIGSPGASRAVGTACATNPVALAIPCHRVIHSGGTMSGYFWGTDRKAALLNHEAGLKEELDG